MKDEDKIVQHSSPHNMRTAPDKFNPALKQLVDQIFTSGQITRREHLQLTSMLLSANKMTEAERGQVNRIFDYIQAGRLKLVD